MSAGLRDRTGRIYAQSNVGTDGMVATRHTFVAERPCRFSPLSTRESILAGQVAGEVRGVVSFDSEAAPYITPEGLIQVDGVFYEIEGPPRVTRLPYPGTAVVDVTQKGDAVYDIVGGP